MGNAPPMKDSVLLTIKLSRSMAEELQAAFRVAGNMEGYGSINDLLVEATRQEMRRLQRGYNNGHPWKTSPSGL
ncbi:hypothetical protein SAMN04489740_4338 [Arthrobacter alpinus]|uniref:ParB-like C-terminal domain-containing protein n=2 Tax=Arthrobacter alpinus TaxID=656366 RepID=A0A1H5PH95_9MICC|nr:hypothetical protein SAMN04489740_4338 [Arthrobacter alpinus]